MAIIDSLTEEQRVAYFGALYAVASADGSVAAEEHQMLVACIDIDGLSDNAKRRVAAFVEHPPCLAECLEALGSAGDDVRGRLLLHLTEVAAVDYRLAPTERALLEDALRLLDVPPDVAAEAHTMIAALSRQAQHIEAERRAFRREERAAHALQREIDALAEDALYLNGATRRLRGVAEATAFAPPGMTLLGAVPLEMRPILAGVDPSAELPACPGDTGAGILLAAMPLHLLDSQPELVDSTVAAEVRARLLGVDLGALTRDMMANREEAAAVAAMNATEGPKAATRALLRRIAKGVGTSGALAKIVQTAAAELLAEMGDA